ncbi:MAG: hypothetical protein J0L93_10120 [Deltaproteobacteria bacterium]|nr:hypothetical protein [Deltaproteobacteria bacterium]
MKFKAIVGVLAVSFCASCGDEGGGSGNNKAFSQDIRLINYDLKVADVKISKISFKGGRENLVKGIGYAPGESTDLVQRVIENGSFILKINDKKADITISSEGRIDRHRAADNAPSPNCRVVGESHIVGEASPLSLNFTWAFKAEVVGGEDCNSQQTGLTEFLNAELNALNLQSAKDLIQAADQKASPGRIFQLTLTVVGEGH